MCWDDINSDFRRWSSNSTRDPLLSTSVFVNFSFFNMTDAHKVDEGVSARVKELMEENQRQLLTETNSLMNKLNPKNSSSNEEQLLKISGIVATGEMPNFKKRSNEEQFKLNAKVMHRLEKAEKCIET